MIFVHGKALDSRFIVFVQRYKPTGLLTTTKPALVNIWSFLLHLVDPVPVSFKRTFFMNYIVDKIAAIGFIIAQNSALLDGGRAWNWHVGQIIVAAAAAKYYATL